MPIDQEIDNNNTLASLILSLTATYLNEEKYLDIWKNLTANTQHTLVFMIQNGAISSCLDDEFKPLASNVSLWNESLAYDNELDVQFSDHLHAAQSVVSLSLSRSLSVCVCVHTCRLAGMYVHIPVL